MNSLGLSRFYGYFFFFFFFFFFGGGGGVRKLDWF